MTREEMPEWLTVAEIAAWMRRSKSYIYDAIKRREIAGA